jgi:hypothetical protein
MSSERIVSRSLSSALSQRPSCLPERCGGYSSIWAPGLPPTRVLVDTTMGIAALDASGVVWRRSDKGGAEPPSARNATSSAGASTSRRDARARGR